ncbi:hypothetical protein J2Y73_005162 [Peribacillus frigoritolerans]|nr:hypothetical protein [Peribacillus frigoritolerans]
MLKVEEQEAMSRAIDEITEIAKSVGFLSDEIRNLSK